MARASKRPLVLDTAEKLFHQQGFNKTGINQITGEAEIASMTLYNNFKNKDALTLAVLERSSGGALAFAQSQADLWTKPELQVGAIFDGLEDWEVLKDFLLLQRVPYEFPDVDHPVRIAAKAHTSAMLKLFESFLSKPKARQVLVLWTGAIAMATAGDEGAVAMAKAVAVALVEADAE